MADVWDYAIAAMMAFNTNIENIHYLPVTSLQQPFFDKVYWNIFKLPLNMTKAFEKKTNLSMPTTIIFSFDYKTHCLKMVWGPGVVLTNTASSLSMPIIFISLINYRYIYIKQHDFFTVNKQQIAYMPLQPAHQLHTFC